MHCATLCQRLNDELDVAAYEGIDAAANGLQVGPSAQPVDKVAFAVDAAVETIDRAADADADLMVVHHGVSWGGIETVTDRHFRRIAPLIENDVALYAAHLPLDGHQSLGNAAGLADLLDLGNRAPFGTVGDQYVGQRGQATERFTVDELQDLLASELDTGDQSVQVLDFGPAQIRDVAVVTGSGTDWLEAAVEADADALITGEGKQKAYHRAREAGVHVFLAGHYATETFGVRTLQDLVAEWGPETTFVDHPTGL